jgi:hypothetical protein
MGPCVTSVAGPNGEAHMREKNEGPSASAIRCRFQATASCCNSADERPFNHQTNWLPPAAIARSPISHIFIPGDMPFISFLLVAGPCAPTPSTSRKICTLPAFSNSRVIGSLSPIVSGLFKSIIIK